MGKRKEKKNKKKNYFSIIYTILTLLFLLILKLINFIPTKYLLIGGLIIITITLINILLIKKRKKIGYVFSIILLLIYIILTYYLGITSNFFSSFSKIHYSEETFLVIVLKDSNYQKMNDLNNKNIGYIDSSLNSTNKALNKISNTITKTAYTDYQELFNALNNSKIESLLIDENYYNIKSEEESTENYRIIHKIKVRSIITKENKEADVTKDTFTIYISGIDTYGSIETVSRSDVNILITVNPNTKQVLLTSIPRDSYVTLSGTTGYKDKLTHAGNYGINMSISTIEELLNIDINYYFRVNFTTLEKVIDSLGGVDVYSKYSFISYIDNYQFYKGYNHMNGKQALAFSRERKSLPEGDIDRGKNQEAVIESIIRKVTSKDIIYNYASLLKELNGSFQTNLTEKEITKLIKKELENIGGWNITSNTITGTGEYNYTYSYQAQKLYVLVLDNESIDNAINLINKVKNNELLESSYNSPENIKNPDKIIVKEEPIPEKEEKNETVEEKVEKEKETNEDKKLTEEQNKENSNDNNSNDDNNNNNNNDNNDNSDNNNKNNDNTPSEEESLNDNNIENNEPKNTP